MPRITPPANSIKLESPAERNRLVDVREVARLTERHPDLIRRWARDGKITALIDEYSHPNQYLIPASEILTVLRMPKKPWRRKST